MEIQVPNALVDLVEQYPFVICDIWGVLHNGIDITQSAVQALRAYREMGGSVILLTNAPKPIPLIAQRFANMGVADRFWDDLITSGSMVTAFLARSEKEIAVHHWGPEEDCGIYEGTPARLTSLSEADVIVCTGLIKNEEQLQKEELELLEDALKRQAIMLCANPDRCVKIGDRMMMCAGILAETYEKMGGEVHWFGKPYPDVYKSCLESLRRTKGNYEPQRVLAIGDGVQTDIAGANAMGFASLLITDGLHSANLHNQHGYDLQAIHDLQTAYDVKIDYCMWRLQ